MKGSLTVEAAYIFPFCFMIIVLLMLLGFYQYNQAVLEITGYECILRTMEERELEEGEFRQNLIQRAMQTAEDRTIGLKNLQVSVKMTASKIALSYQGQQTVILLPVEKEIVYERTFPELTLKMTKGISGNLYGRIFKERTGEDLFGFEQ